MAHFSFTVVKKDTDSAARLGILKTPHSEIETPVFMPVGTAGSVKAMPHDALEAMDARVILANTYHLFLRPGHECVEGLGGLHRFMAWNRSILTDSGGYQVFSHQALRKITEEGVTFRSHLDGSLRFLSPEVSIAIQEALGSDIMMVLDECTPWPATWETAKASMNLSLRWAHRCRVSWRYPDRQWLFGIIQGGMYADLRRECLNRLMDIDFPGYAIGGLSVGEPKPQMYEIAAMTAENMPAEKPRYVMGVGTPEDLFECVSRGLDMFDCVMPTRNARNGCLFTSQGRIVIKNARFAHDAMPPDPECECPVCKRYSRAYLRHLYMAGEIMSCVLNTCHNLYFYLDTMRKIRQSIAFGAFGSFKDRFLRKYQASGRQ